MSASKMSVKFLVRDKVSTLYLLISTMICHISLFTLFNICYLEGRDGEGGVLGIIIFISTFISAYLFWYINNMSIETRRKEMAVQTICGLPQGKIALLSILQLIVISGVSVLVSYIIASILSPIFVGVVYGMSGQVAPEFKFSLEALIVPMIIVLIQFIFVLFNTAGMVFRCEPIELFKKEKGIKFLNVSATLVKLFLSIMLIKYIGFIGVIYCSLLLFIDIAFKKKNYNKKTFMVYKFLKKALDGSLFLVVGYIAVKFSTIMFMRTGLEDAYLATIGVVGVSMMLVIVTVAFIYKSILGLIENKKEYKTLSMIGYSKKEVKSIMKMEMGVFCGFITLVPILDMPTLILLDNSVTNYLLAHGAIHIVITSIATIIILKIANNLMDKYIDN